MKTLLVLIKRNIFVFCKDKANLFYSSLSMLIIIMLMLVFLGNMNVDMVNGSLRDADKMMQGVTLPMDQLMEGDRDSSKDDANARNLVLSMIIAGLTVVNGVTVSLGVIGLMVEDEAQNRLSSFYVSPVSRSVLVLAYILAAFILSIAFGVVTVLISEVVLVMSGGTMLTTIQLIKVSGLIILNSFSATCFMFFLSTFAHSLSAYSGLSTLVGTLVGFISGMYLPMGVLPETVKKVLVLFPICSGSAWMREVFTEEAAARTFAGLPKQGLEFYREYSGITLKFADMEISNLIKFLILFGSGILFIIISAIILRKKNVRDR
ncbi:MAG: hypothetical protein K0S76_2228 [Herbinix sp.]|nr:hypothetical protein [Herbinix sp.]